MTLYLTSDLHLGHALVADIRGYGQDVATHDEWIMSALHRLTEQDDLWILGDITSGTRSAETRALELLGSLKCRLHLVNGNHDSCSSIHRDGWKRQESFRAVFASIQDFARRRGPAGATVMMSHYPYRVDHTEVARYDQYRLRDEGAWLLHGHTHQTHVRTSAREIHIGWDTWSRPVAWSEIEAIINEGVMQ